MMIERGLKRMSYVLCGVISLIVLAIAASDGPAQLGAAVVYLLIGFLVYMILFKLAAISLRWIVRGFKRDKSAAKD